MIIYEVNLEIDKTIYESYKTWLLQHIQEILHFPGFIKAFLLQEIAEEVSLWHKLSVHYYLKSTTDLDHYLNHHAPAMRAEGEQLFSGKFKAWRRVLIIEKEIN